VVESTSVGNDNVVPLVTDDPTSEQRSAAAMVSIARDIEREVLRSVSKRMKLLSLHYPQGESGSIDRC
jgi:hypothetical protein